MVLTPTYHVFDMYKVHQDAVMIPISLETDSIDTDQGRIPALHISSSLDKDGKIHITACNLNAEENETEEVINTIILTQASNLQSHDWKKLARIMENFDSKINE